MAGAAAIAPAPADAPPEERPDAPRSASGPRRDRRRAIVAIVIAIVIVAAVVLLREEQLATAPNGPPAPSVLAPENTMWPLSPGFYEDLSFQLRTPATISGGLYASAGMEAYLFNATEYSNYATSGTTSPHDWASGNTTSLRIYQELPAGEWSLVIANPSATLTSTVTVTTAVLATASG